MVSHPPASTGDGPALPPRSASMKWLLSTSRADNPSLVFYRNWVEAAGVGTAAVCPSLPLPEADRFDALLLTGGGDIGPALYDRPKHPKTAGILPGRDEMELRLADRFLSAGRPVLGICRGLQLIHVFFGGRLLQHLPDLVPEGEERHRQREGFDAEHALAWRPGTDMASSLGAGAGVCNSAHHQAADPEAPGRGLAIAAVSPAGVIEALESDSATGPFVSCVQWHPERMTAAQPASGGLRAYWMEQVGRTTDTFQRSKASRASWAAIRWPVWTGLKHPPNTPMR